MDLGILNEFSRFVEWEGDAQWFQVPIDRTASDVFGFNARWLKALAGQANVASRLSCLWEELAPFMPRSIAAFSEKITELAILRTRESGVSLVYFFWTGEDYSLRRGHMPATGLPTIASSFPIDLRPLYRLHNGLVHFMSYDGGPLPLQEWKTLTDPETKQPSFVKICSDGTEAFGFDISENPCRGFLLRPNDDDVEEIDDAWAYLDDLVASRIEDL